MRTLVEREDGVYDGNQRVVPRSAIRMTDDEGVAFVAHGQKLRFWNVHDGFAAYPTSAYNAYHLTFHLRLDNETTRRTVFAARVTSYDWDLDFAGLQDPVRRNHEARIRFCDGETMRLERTEAWRDSDLRKGIVSTFSTDLPPVAAEAALLLLLHWPPEPFIAESKDPLPPRLPLGY